MLQVIRVANIQTLVSMYTALGEFKRDIGNELQLRLRETSCRSDVMIHAETPESVNNHRDPGVYIVLVNPNIYTENRIEYVEWNLNPLRKKPPVLLDTLHFSQLRMWEMIRGEGVEFSRGVVQERKSQQHN
jgi:hypothetical protein